MKESEKVLNEIKSMEGGLEVDYLLSLLQENISNSAAISEETEASFLLERCLRSVVVVMLNFEWNA